MVQNDLNCFRYGILSPGVESSSNVLGDRFEAHKTLRVFVSRKS